jgi:hypothetical protein
LDDHRKERFMLRSITDTFARALTFVTLVLGGAAAPPVAPAAPLASHVIEASKPGHGQLGVGREGVERGVHLHILEELPQRF